MGEWTEELGPGCRIMIDSSAGPLSLTVGCSGAAVRTPVAACGVADASTVAGCVVAGAPGRLQDDNRIKHKIETIRFGMRPLSHRTGSRTTA